MVQRRQVPKVKGRPPKGVEQGSYFLRIPLCASAEPPEEKLQPSPSSPGRPDLDLHDLDRKKTGIKHKEFMLELTEMLEETLLQVVDAKSSKLRMPNLI